MYSGYILFCDKSAFGNCLSKRTYSCTDKHGDEVASIKKGSVLFIYNPDTKDLVGPFTAASQGAERIETGTWTSHIDDHSASANIKLEWQDLHIMKNADSSFPYVAKPEKCELPTLRVQELLDALKKSPVFEG